MDVGPVKVSQDVQEVVSKLKFFSKIKKGERLNVKDLSVTKDNVVSRAIRAWYAKGDEGEYIESREISLEFVQSVCDEALRLARKILHEQNYTQREMWKMLIESLKDAQFGISNFLGTYSDDRMYISKVETFIDLLKAQIREMEGDKGKIDALENKKKMDENQE